MFLHDLCKALEEAKIAYAIVGGYAVALHGVPRTTLYIDFVIQWSLETLEKAEKVLKDLGLVSRIPVDAKNVFLFRDDYIKNRNLIAWNFYDPAKPLNQVDLVITFDLKKAMTKTIKTRSGSIKVLSKQQLIAMKKASGRPQDLEDIKTLEAL